MHEGRAAGKRKRLKPNSIKTRKKARRKNISQQNERGTLNCSFHKHCLPAPAPVHMPSFLHSVSTYLSRDLLQCARAYWHNCNMLIQLWRAQKQPLQRVPHGPALLYLDAPGDVSQGHGRSFSPADTSGAFLRRAQAPRKHSHQRMRRTSPRILTIACDVSRKQKQIGDGKRADC